MNKSLLIGLFVTGVAGCMGGLNHGDMYPVSPTRWAVVYEDGSVRQGRKLGAGLKMELTKYATCTMTCFDSVHRWGEEEYVGGMLTRRATLHPQDGWRTWEQVLVTKSGNIWRNTSFYADGTRRVEYDVREVRTSRGSHANHGLYREWHTNGTLKISCTFDEGRLVDQFTCCREDGTLICSGVYRNGKPWSGTLPVDLTSDCKALEGSIPAFEHIPWDGSLPVDLGSDRPLKIVEYRNGETVKEDR